MYEVPDWKISAVYNGVNPSNYDGFLGPGDVKRRYDIGPMDPMVLFSGRLVCVKVYPNPDSIAWALGTMFKNFEWVRWMGRNGRIAVETAFSWNSIADHVLGVYGSIECARGAAA